MKLTTYLNEAKTKTTKCISCGKTFKIPVKENKSGLTINHCPYCKEQNAIVKIPEKKVNESNLSDMKNPYGGNKTKYQYANPFYNPEYQQSEPVHFTDDEPIMYKGYKIFHRKEHFVDLNTDVYDVVRDGTIIGMYAGLNGAKDFIDKKISDKVNESEFTDMMDAETGGRHITGKIVATVNGINFDEKELKDMADCFDVETDGIAFRNIAKNIERKLMVMGKM